MDERRRYVPCEVARQALGISLEAWGVMIERRRLRPTNVNGVSCIHLVQLEGIPSFDRGDDKALGLEPYLVDLHDPDHDWLTCSAGAKLAGVHKDTILIWYKRRLISGNTAGTPTLYSREDIIRVAGRKERAYGRS